jgi:hypothetical protein
MANDDSTDAAASRSITNYCKGHCHRVRTHFHGVNNNNNNKLLNSFRIESRSCNYCDCNMTPKFKPAPTSEFITTLATLTYVLERHAVFNISMSGFSVLLQLYLYAFIPGLTLNFAACISNYCYH